MRRVASLSDIPNASSSSSSSNSRGGDGSLMMLTAKRGRSPTQCGTLSFGGDVGGELSLKKSKTINDLSVFSSVCEMYALVDGVDNTFNCVTLGSGGGGGSGGGRGGRDG